MMIALLNVEKKIKIYNSPEPEQDKHAYLVYTHLTITWNFPNVVKLEIFCSLDS